MELDNGIGDADAGDQGKPMEVRLSNMVAAKGA